MKENSSDLKKFRIRQRLQKAMSNSMEKLGMNEFNSCHFDVEQVDVNISSMDAVFDGFSIAHITDIHLGQWMSKERLNGVIDLVNEQKPDLVAITGDFVSYAIDDIVNDLKHCLSLLQPNIDSIAVLGNHDHWLGADKIRKMLKESQIIDISNDIYTVERKGANLHFAGVDSVTLNKHRLDIIMEKLPESGPAILLAHEPDFADISSTTGRFSLQISGHSHGGQFIIPGIGTFIRGPNFLKYPVGKYQVGDMIQYTNRGLGTNIFWFRINCPPEITIFNLKST